MKHTTGIPHRLGTPGLRFGHSAMLSAFILGLIMIASTTVLAAAVPVIVFRAAPGEAYKLYVPTTKATVTLAGTEKMNNVVIGDVDGDGAEDEMVYSNAVGGKLGYYKIPGDALWHPERNHAIPNTPADAVPLTVLRMGSLGTKARIVYAWPSYRRSVSVTLNGVRDISGWMDKAYAADVRQRGIKSDLVWWTNGVGMRWRAGFLGYDYKAPRTDWIPIGCGRLDANFPAGVIAFYTSTGYDPSVYFADRYWRMSKVQGGNWPWTVNKGSSIIGDVDGDGVGEFVLCMSSIHPLQWYNVPPNQGSFDFSSLVTVNNVLPGWNVVGVAKVNLTAVTPPPPPPPTVPVAVSNISQLATLADGTLVQLTAKSRTKLVVETVSGGTTSQTGYYIEEADGTKGIRIVGQTNTAEGQQIAVRGTLGTLNGERVINADTQTVSTTIMKIASATTTIKALLGATMTGLLVSVPGKISTADITSGTFDFADGLDAIRVYAPGNTNTSGPFTITGCLGAEKNSAGGVSPVLRLQSSLDMVATPAPPPVIVPTYAMWTATSLDKVYKTDAAKALVPAAIRSAKNEHEAFQIVLRGGSQPASSVTLTPRDLVGPTTIPAANVSMCKVNYVHLPNFNTDLPDALPPYTGAFALAAGQTQPIWVDVYVPKTAPAGDYNGVVTVSDASGAKTDISYTLHVYNFTLPDDWKLKSAFGLWDEQISQQHQQVIHQAAHTQTVKNYYDFMLQHGISAVTLPYGVDVGTDVGTKYLTDPRLSSFAIPYYSSATWLKSILAKFESLGVLDKAYMYTYDEPYTQSVFEIVKKYANELHAANPRAKAMVTFSDFPVQENEPTWANGTSYPAGTLVGHLAQGYYTRNYLFRCKVAHVASVATEPNVGGSWQTYWERMTHMDMLKGYVDIWCVGSGVYSQMKDKLAQRIAAGESVWTYNWFGAAKINESPIRINPTIETRLQTWMGYHYGTTGMLWWCSDFWQGCPNPWTNLMNSPLAAGEGILFYPGYQVGIDSGVSSIRMKAVQDGLEDYQYFWLLEQKLGRAAALAYVDQLATGYSTWVNNPTLLNSVRDQIATKLEN